MRRVNSFALAIQLSPIFLLPHDLFPLLFGDLHLFLNLHPNLDRSFCGSLRFFRIGLALGSRFPLAHSSPHEGRTVDFSHITAFDKQREHAYVSAIVIQLKLPALESIEYPWAGLPTPLKREA